MISCTRRRRGADGEVVVCVDDVRLAQLADALAFFAPDLERIELPAWDCLPLRSGSRPARKLSVDAW
ncbi:MAG: hypothetical protein IPK78_07825 [Rhodospirillales bacterium]|nr:hypothetical protein [Rhodospirillales bacterium]